MGKAGPRSTRGLRPGQARSGMPVCHPSRSCPFPPLTCSFRPEMGQHSGGQEARGTLRFQHTSLARAGLCPPNSPSPTTEATTLPQKTVFRGRGEGLGHAERPQKGSRTQEHKDTQDLNSSLGIQGNPGDCERPEGTDARFRQRRHVAQGAAGWWPPGRGPGGMTGGPLSSEKGGETPFS